MVDGKNDLQTCCEGGTSRKRPTLVVGKKAWGKCQIMNVRVLLFSLGVAGLAVAGCQQLPVAAPNHTFHLTVEQVITNSEILVSLLKIETREDVYLSVPSVVNAKSAISVLMAGGSNGAVRSGLVAFSAARFSRPGDEHAQVQLCEREQSGGNSVQGLYWWPVPSATELGGSFSISAADGDYPLGTPIQIGDWDGKPVLLTVEKMMVGQRPKAGE